MRIGWHILYYPLAIFGIASSLSAIFADRNIHLAGEQSTWVKMMAFPLALALYRRAPSLRDLALRMILFFGATIAIMGFGQYLIEGQRDLEHRITGPASHVMTFSGLLLPVALIFLVLWFHDRRNLWLLGGAALTTSALMLTFTRSAWLGWVVAVFALLLIRRPRWIIVAVPLLVLFIDFMPLAMFGRLISTFDTRQSSNLDRIRMVEGGVEIIKDYPLLGVGPANVKEIYPLYRKPDAPRFRIPHLHNNVVQLWAERGVLALAAYLLLLALFVRACFRSLGTPGERYGEMGLAVTIGLTVAGLFEFNFGDTEIFFMLLDTMALVIAFVEPYEVQAGDLSRANEAGGVAVPVLDPIRL